MNISSTPITYIPTSFYNWGLIHCENAKELHFGYQLAYILPKLWHNYLVDLLYIHIRSLKCLLTKVHSIFFWQNVSFLSSYLLESLLARSVSKYFFCIFSWSKYLSNSQLVRHYLPKHFLNDLTFIFIKQWGSNICLTPVKQPFRTTYHTNIIVENNVILLQVNWFQSELKIFKWCMLFHFRFYEISFVFASE